MCGYAAAIAATACRLFLPSVPSRPCFRYGTLPVLLVCRGPGFVGAPRKQDKDVLIDLLVSRAWGTVSLCEWIMECIGFFLEEEARRGASEEAGGHEMTSEWWVMMIDPPSKRTKYTRHHDLVRHHSTSHTLPAILPRHRQAFVVAAFRVLVQAQSSIRVFIRRRPSLNPSQHILQAGREADKHTHAQSLTRQNHG